MSRRKIWTRVGLSGLTLVGLLAVAVLYMGWHQKAPRDVSAPAGVEEMPSGSVPSLPPVTAPPPSENSGSPRNSSGPPAGSEVQTQAQRRAAQQAELLRQWKAEHDGIQAQIAGAEQSARPKYDAIPGLDDYRPGMIIGGLIGPVTAPPQRTRVGHLPPYPAPASDSQGSGISSGAGPVPSAAGPTAQAPTPSASGGSGGAGRSPASVDTGDGEIDAELARLKQGNLAYNTPETMKTGKTARVVARIGSEKVTVRALTQGMPSEEDRQTATAPTPVSTRMKMTLKSADFDITALSSEEQIVGGDAPTMWEWDITPKHSGKLGLHLAAVVELHNLARDFTTVDREIAVAVDPVGATEDFLKTNTVWVLGLLGAGGTAVWTWLKKRKKPQAAGWQTP